MEVLLPKLSHPLRPCLKETSFRGACAWPSIDKKLSLFMCVKSDDERLRPIFIISC